jgi:serine/threonine protein kinase
MSPSPGLSIEGYSLLRKIGEGGFGEVWLCKSETTGAWKALKWISKHSHRHLEQELSALSRYSNAVSGTRSPNLVPIEHVRLLDGGLIYLMPLADGFYGHSPEDPSWEPMTLSGVMRKHQSEGTWFSQDKIKNVILGVVQGAGLIGEAGLQHRDIKPENVLFIRGEPALADFGLATEDTTQVSMRGTPHHAAPTWYLESGGNSDQWGVASLLYQLLTGNSPDKMGRPKYLQPPTGMVLNGEGERSEWNRLQSLVNRATSEIPGERFKGFLSFKNALHAEMAEGKSRIRRWALPLALVGVAVFLLLLATHKERYTPSISRADSSQPKTLQRAELKGPMKYDDALKGPVHVSPEDRASWEALKGAH